MVAICSALGLARSNVDCRASHSPHWVDGRIRRTCVHDDETLVAQIRAQIADLPSYGYRKARALVNRVRRRRGLPAVNHTRVYRIMAAMGCC